MPVDHPGRDIPDRPGRLVDVHNPRAGGRGDQRRIDDLTGARTTALVLLGLPALLPLVLIAPAIAHLDPTTHAAGNDVLGTGGALLLFATLAVTPAITITGHRWFAPLRQWYGIAFGLDVITDAALASNDPAFGRDPAATLTGHTFLVVGLVMVTIAVPLTLTANRASMRRLGRYWRPVQATGTYLIWAGLGAHLALLEGFGYAADDRLGVEHQRLYQYAACTIPLVVLRLPPVRRAYRRRDAGRGRVVYTLATTALVALFAAGWLAFANELIFKGLAAWHLHAIVD